MQRPTDSQPMRMTCSRDINGLVVIIAVLIVLMLLPGPAKIDLQGAGLIMRNVASAPSVPVANKILPK